MGELTDKLKEVLETYNSAKAQFKAWHEATNYGRATFYTLKHKLNATRHYAQRVKV
jgi:hypothetical protein